MIEKWFEVSCDICGCWLVNYAMFKPTSTALRRKGIKVIINNGKVHTYCEKCYEKHIKRNRKNESDNH